MSDRVIKTIVVVVKEKCPKTGKINLVVSHGVDYDTGKTVILPMEHPLKIGAVFSEDVGEFVLFEWHQDNTEIE